MLLRSISVFTASLGFATLAQASEIVYDVEPTHAFVHFEALHSGTSTNRGRFDKIEGVIKLDRAAGKGSADITIYPDTVNTGVESYNEHLMSDDFLAAKAHPVATFKGSDFVFDGAKVTAVKGELTLLGKAQPVTLTAQRFNCFNSRHFEQREICGGDFETAIKRSEFGMNYGLPGIPDDIRLLIQIEALQR